MNMGRLRGDDYISENPNFSRFKPNSNNFVFYFHYSIIVSMQYNNHTSWPEI